MRICKRCRQEINPKDVKTELLDNLCWCRSCFKAKQDERNAKYSASCHNDMKSTGKWIVGKTYSTKGMSIKEKSAMFMGGILETEHAGLSVEAKS